MLRSVNGVSSWVSPALLSLFPALFSAPFSCYPTPTIHLVIPQASRFSSRDSVLLTNSRRSKRDGGRGSQHPKQRRRGTRSRRDRQRQRSSREADQVTKEPIFSCQARVDDYSIGMAASRYSMHNIFDDSRGLEIFGLD